MFVALEYDSKQFTVDLSAWVEVGTPTARGLLDRSVFSEADLLELGDLAAREILRRTRRGLDASERPFKPYSERYAKRRAKAGRNTAPVDLTFTGEMIAALTTGVEDDAAALGFDNLERGYIAAVHHEGRGRNPRRRWLAVEPGTALAKKLSAFCLRRLKAKLERTAA